MESAVFAPLVSIIIPVYNGSNYMREAIDSACRKETELPAHVIQRIAGDVKQMISEKIQEHNDGKQI